jgi:ribosomal protein S17E
MKAVSEQLNRHSDIFTRDAEANKQLIEALQQHLQLRQSILETVN